MKPVWIFDLDNTLHNATPHIFPHINRSMTEYIQRQLGVNKEAANALRMDYWLRYGATLKGLMRHHDTDPHHFLWHTHQFPALSSMVLREPRLRQALIRLPGRKLVFSNAPLHYAHEVLKLLRVDDLFMDIFTLEHTGFRPKPETGGFLKLLHKHRLLPELCVMVEDSTENLQTAKRLGMHTVWVSKSHRQPAYVDVKISEILQLPSTLARITKRGKS